MRAASGLPSAALAALGVALLAAGAVWQLGLWPGNQATLPPPVALERPSEANATDVPLVRAAPPTADLASVATPPIASTRAEGGRAESPPAEPTLQPVPVAATVRQKPAPLPATPPRAPVSVPTADTSAQPRATAIPRRTAGVALPVLASGQQDPLPTSSPAVPSTVDQAAAVPATLDQAAADNEDEAVDPAVGAAGPVVPGYALRLAIPAIHLDTPVEQAGLVQDADGNWAWETRPFVAVHYGDLTALVGAPGNAVIAGHVATLFEGNVFENLNRVRLGDAVQVADDQGQVQQWIITQVRLVLPTDTSVMDPTSDPTLTLITCGGPFDPVARQFLDRLVVTASPA